MSRIVIDSNSLQASQHLHLVHNSDPLGRLTSFVSTINGLGHFTEEDGKLAKEFGIEISEACFCTDPAPARTVIRSTGTDDHPLLISRSRSV